MWDETSNPDSIEAGLAELDRAERAGVYRPTPFDRRWLAPANESVRYSPTGWVSLMSRRRWIAAASLVLLAGGVWGVMFAYHLSTIRPHSRTEPVRLADAGSFAAGSVITCLRGPSGDGRNGCRAGDLDGDGDVDLADYGALQVVYVSQSR